jgi:hypothetical protein
MPAPESLSDFAAHSFERPPIQEGSIRVVWDRQFGGPAELGLGNVGDPSDSRLVLSRQELEMLLKIAEQSITGRVVIHHAGIRVRLLEDGGHRFKSIRLVGDPPAPETSSIFGG